MLGLTPVRNYRKNARPSFYNLRFSPSQGIDNMYVQYNSPLQTPNGAEPHKTQRDPNAFNFSNNIFRNDYMEWRMRAADYLYQISSRMHRSNDGWTRTLVAWSAFSWMMFAQAPIWKIHFLASTMILAARIRDKGAEPTIDEVALLDTVFKNEKLNKLFTPETYHVIDFDQEWEAGRGNLYFPEYRTSVAKFFNVDCNTTEGRYKFGDVESGAMMTLHFKTMPFSNNKYNFTEPFMVYDMMAEVSHEGEYFTEHLVKAEEHLRSKRIFVLWH